MAATALQQAALLHFLCLLLFLQLHVLRVLEIVALQSLAIFELTVDLVKIRTQFTRAASHVPHHRVPARKQVEADNTGLQCELCAIM